MQGQSTSDPRRLGPWPIQLRSCFLHAYARPFVEWRARRTIQNSGPEVSQDELLACQLSLLRNSFEHVHVLCMPCLLALPMARWTDLTALIVGRGKLGYFHERQSTAYYKVLTTFFHFESQSVRPATCPVATIPPFSLSSFFLFCFLLLLLLLLLPL